jgi:hypothetical protein
MTEEYGHISDGFFLSQEEVNDLRKAKKELTQYGRQKIKEMTTGQLMDTEKFQEEFSKSKVFDADKFEEENRKQRSARILSRYNDFYNLEVSGLSHGTPTSMEELQAITLRSMLDALITEHMNQEYNSVEICDVEDLIDGLYQQGKDYLKLKDEDK